LDPRAKSPDLTLRPRLALAYVAGRRGRHGNLATWRWNYTHGFPDAYFDAVAILQSVQHAEDWSETATELLRVLKPGHPIVLSEITLGPNMVNAASLDIHIQSWIDKIFARMGWQVADFPYYSPETVLRAFAGKVESAETFSWRGIELFWGRKPTTSS
jgi:SAM-dependent methyltransferase